MIARLLIGGPWIGVATEDSSVTSTRPGLIGILLLAIAGQLQPAAAQTYPTRQIVMVVPFAPGGPSDVIARIFADQMGRSLGQQIVVENVGGAGGTLGSARVAAAEPDGYTLLAGSMGSHVAAPVLYGHLKYDPTRDFEPVGLTAHAPVVVVARKDFPPTNMKSFVTYLKENGETVKEAHGGVGSSSHMACLLLTSQLGLHPTSVAYRGTGQAINDILAGNVDFLCEQVVSVASQVNGGTIKAYAVSADQRSPSIPTVPTTIETGFPQFQMSIWSGIFAPKGAPKEIIAKLAAALDQALDHEALRKRLIELGASIPSREERTQPAFDRFVKAEVARWGPILRTASASAN
ncbi:MAG: tripartite tricarboxylate transporter substrate-binding protein [Xanthobacteraceae bacterium]